MKRRTFGFAAATTIVGLAGCTGIFDFAGSEPPVSNPGNPSDEHAIRIDGNEPLSLAPEPDQTVRGDVTDTDSDEIHTRLRATGEHAFLKTQRTPLEDDGSFTVTFDLSDLPESKSTATLYVVADADTDREFDVTITA